MEICAIILNYFGSAATLECINSLRKDNVLKKIVIVENSATEEERSRIEQSIGEKELICLLCPGKNLGFAGGVNFALSSPGMAAFEAFLILNNDTLVPAGTVSLLEKRLLEGDFCFVAPAIHEYTDSDSLWSNGNAYNRLTGLISQHRMSLTGTVNYLTGCCLLIRRTVFERIGLFDETFFMYGEDVDFCFRAAKMGLKYGVVSEARIFHKGSASSGNNSIFYEYHVNRGHLLLCQRLARNPQDARLCRISKLMVIFLRAFWRALKYGNLNSLRGLRMAVSDFLRGGANVSKGLQ